MCVVYIYIYISLYLTVFQGVCVSVYKVFPQPRNGAKGAESLQSVLVLLFKACCPQHSAKLNVLDFEVCYKKINFILWKG